MRFTIHFKELHARPEPSSFSTGSPLPNQPNHITVRFPTELADWVSIRSVALLFFRTWNGIDSVSIHPGGKAVCDLANKVQVGEDKETEEGVQKGNKQSPTVQTMRLLLVCDCLSLTHVPFSSGIQ